MALAHEIFSEDVRKKYNLDALIEGQKNKINAVFKYGDRGIYSFNRV